MPSLRPMEHSREVARSDRNDRFPLARRGAMQRRNRSPDPHKGKRGHPMLRQPPPMTAPPRPHNARKYCEFHKQSGHTMNECRELKNALHELANKGQIDRFLKRGSRFLRQEQTPAPPLPWDEEYSTEFVATIAGGYVEEITRAAWKAQLRSAQQVLAVEQGSCITAPTMVFGGKDAPRFASPYNDPLVVERKIASAFVRRILVDMGSFADIITRDCLKRLSPPGRDLVPMADPIPGFEGQEINPTGMIRLPVRFGDKSKFKSLEVGFLLVDVPTAYNGRGPPQQPAHARPKNNGHLQTHLQGSARPCRGIRGCRSGPAGSPTPSPGTHQSRPSPASAVRIEPLTVPLVPADESLQPPAFCDGLHPPGKDLSHCYLLLGRLWGVRSPRGRFNYVLDQKKSNAEVRLDKASRGPRGERGGPTGNPGHSSCSFGRSWVPLLSRGPFPRRPNFRQANSRPAGPLFPHWRGGGGPSLVRLFLGPLLLADRQTHSRPLLVGYKGGRLEERQTKVIYRTFLACWATRSCLSSSRLCSAAAATCSGAASPVSNTVSRALAWFAQNKQEVRSALNVNQVSIEMTKLAPSLLGPLHRLNHLSHEPRDRPRLIIFAYIEHKITGSSSFLSRGLPKRLPNRLSFIPIRDVTPAGCLTLDFFSMAVMKPDLLLKQYHPKSPISLGALWTI
ncbi:hypothetical protein Cgig2_021630 [Carnegiea gigantea]|uniref:Reverse transcriptase domain-containing protein n=1 Tax=Carnegiea gigantea TaxID=171969 RepID=A0A9Q1JPE7_9CARY|nr:hypothetical protein Cgig2_021630 [Carnegiea gigantea]